jgi:hypothetical protein
MRRQTRQTDKFPLRDKRCEASSQRSTSNIPLINAAKLSRSCSVKQWEQHKRRDSAPRLHRALTECRRIPAAECPTMPDTAEI